MGDPDIALVRLTANRSGDRVSASEKGGLNFLFAPVVLGNLEPISHDLLLNPLPNVEQAGA